MTSRRSFLAGLLAAAAAPAFVRSESLMGLWVPKPMTMPEPPGIWRASNFDDLHLCSGDTLNITWSGAVLGIHAIRVIRFDNGAVSEVARMNAADIAAVPIDSTGRYRIEVSA